MTPTQLELTRLLGSKELTDGCTVAISYKLRDGSGRKQIQSIEPDTVIKGSELGSEFFSDGYSAGKGNNPILEEIIGHPVTISDFHRWLIDKCLIFEQRALSFVVKDVEMNLLLEVSYLSSKPLLDQEEATLSAILNLVKSHD